MSVSDGDAPELTVNSNAIYILNSPPLITSQSYGRITEGVYEYKVTAEDADGDPLSFSLSKAPEGMTIDPSTGLIRWEIGEGQREGDYKFDVTVSDSEGALAIQTVTLKISF